MTCSYRDQKSSAISYLGRAIRPRLLEMYIEVHSGRIALEHLPDCAPQLNPVDYISGYLKHRAMPSYCACNLTDLRQRASRNLRSLQRRSTLVTASWKLAELY